MANPFDQFDAPVQTPQSSGANPFDQFDSVSSGEHPHAQGAKNNAPNNVPPGYISNNNQNNLPQFESRPDDTTGDRLLKNVINTITPYAMESNPNITPSQKVADAVKSGASGVAQGLTAMGTGPVDIAHNVGEAVGNRVGKAITGIDVPPEYSDYTGDAIRDLGIGYQPKTAMGNALQTEGQLAGPAAGGKVVSAMRDSNFLSGEGTRAGQAADFNAAQTARPTSQQLREISGRTFDRAKQIGATYTPDAADALVKTVHNEMLESGKLTPNLHPKALGTLNDMAQDVQNGFDLQDLHGWRQAFGDAINSDIRPNGTMGPDGQRAFAAQTGIDNFLRGPGKDPTNLVNGSPEAVEALQNGMSLWGSAARMDDIQRIINNSMLRDNPATSMRSGFASLASSPKRLRGFDPTDQDLIVRASQASLPAEFMRSAGSRLLNIAGMGSGNPLYAAGSQMGTAAARSLQAGMQARRGTDILDNIAKRVDLPDLNTIEPPKQLGAPPIYGEPPSEPPAPAPSAPQHLLPRGDQDTFYQPQGRALTYQPRADWEVSPEGFATKPSDLVPTKTSAADRALAARAGQETADRNVKRLMITHQPRSNFVGTDNGIVQAPSDRVGALLGEDQDMPIDSGEVQAIRSNPKWPPESKRGGAINKKKGGGVFPRPKYYPALQRTSI